MDRDGTLCEEGPAPRKFTDLRVFDGAAGVIKALKQMGFLVIVVTNQAAVAKGIISLADVEATHSGLVSHFREHGADLDAVLYCPHHPKGVVPAFSHTCRCRKPAPGLLFEAAREFGLDLHQSWMVGDNLTDIEAGLSAGCRVALVRTGHGHAFAAQVAPHGSHIAILDDISGLQNLVV